MLLYKRRQSVDLCRGTKLLKVTVSKIKEVLEKTIEDWNSPLSCELKICTDFVPKYFCCSE